MAMRKLQHKHVPIWIKLRHLPMEYWTTDGLSTVASGVGRPLYPDAITRACTRLDFARVCVMIDVAQTLPKHIIVMTPDENGGETPCKVDVEYEWLPPKCTNCMILGHMTKDCPLNKIHKPSKPPVAVYVAKTNTPLPQPNNEKSRKPMRQTIGDIPRREEGEVLRERKPDKHDDRGSPPHTIIAFYRGLLTTRRSFCMGTGKIKQENTIVGVPMFAVTRKLKALKPVFREQRRKKGDLTLNVQLAKGFLDEAQQLVSSDRQNEAFLLLEHCCRLVYAKAAKLEQIMLQQRAKMQWMKGGDQCSRIFFRKIAKRRVARRILQINDDNGTIHTEPEEIINEFVCYYQNLLGGNRRQITLDIGFLRPLARHILSNEEAGHLILAFTPDDVKQAVFDIADDKAPGPDGYSSGFFKAAWPVVGQEVTKAVLEFFSTGKLLKQVNSTLLALIPKVHTPMTVGDFRPISCCNVLYKIIAKLLVQRLSVVLDKIISPYQGAFILGRSIWDNILLAQELLTGYNQVSLPPRCTLKVDIKKAYDTVEWDFLLAVLQLFGFPQTFTRWIEECVTTAAFSIGLNGNPHGFFAGARGLRQGDPLSPYLFVLVMEVLHLGLLQLIEQDSQFSFH
ncbi:UNVERIFIED_CONTAM: hypothetical protein Sindi_0095800 [Sesamum indicum]